MLTTPLSHWADYRLDDFREEVRALSFWARARRTVSVWISAKRSKCSWTTGGCTVSAFQINKKIQRRWAASGSLGFYISGEIEATTLLTPQPDELWHGLMNLYRCAKENAMAGCITSRLSQKILHPPHHHGLSWKILHPPHHHSLSWKILYPLPHGLTEGGKNSTVQY